MISIDFYQQKVWELQSTCECGGTGYVSANLPVGHPAFGRSFWCMCKRMEVLQKQLAETVFSDTIPEDAYNYDLPDFERVPHAAYALQCAKQLLDGGKVYDKEAQRERYGMLLFGGTGSFKTTLASVVYRHWLGTGKSVQWHNASALVKRVQATYAADYEGADYEQIINTIARLDGLVLDDMGSPTRKEQYSEDHIEILLRIMNYREAQHLPLIVTSNCHMRQLSVQFGPRNFSRFNGLMAFVSMHGKDVRLGEREVAELRVAK